MIEAIGLAAAAAIGLWLFGGIVLRFAGVVVVLSGVVSATQGEAWGLAVALTGVAFWLAGHWHFALRHRYWKSALAQSLALRLPISNPATGWGVQSVAALRRTDLPRA